MSQPPIQESMHGGAVPAPAGPAPVPVQALHYVVSDRAGRPGLVTAIGVMSIVVACFSGLFGLITGLQTVGYYFMSIASSQAAVARTTVVQGRAQTTVTLSQNGPAPAAQTGQRGMNAQEREGAVVALTRMRPMTPARKRQLDAILALAGTEMRTDTVTESGTMADLRSGEPPPDYFVTSTGRLEVFNDRAVFFPANNTPTVRVSAPMVIVPDEAAGESAGSADGGSPDAPATTALAVGALAPAETASVIQQAQSVGSNALNTAQVNALQTLLGAPGQQLVQPGGAQGAVVSVYPQPNGMVSVQFSDGGSVTLGPQGNVVSMITAPVMPMLNFNPVALVVSLVATVVSLGLAVFLLVSGIVTLGQSPRGRRLHLVYAWIKIPLELVAVVAALWIARDLMASVATGGAGVGVATLSYGLVTGLIPALLGLAYPVGLLIALNTRAMREYYGAPAEAGRGG
jgi:hypothetical protein